jgi:hypothetical protein
MTDFYRGPGARITDELFVTRSPFYQAFAVSGLSKVYVTEGQARGVAAAVAPLRVGSAAVAAVAASVAVAAWPVFHNPAMSLASLAVLGTSLIVALVCWRARARPQQLWGIYQGQLVCLYQSTDRLAFGQVRRALLRVFEQIDDMR